MKWCRCITFSTSSTSGSPVTPTTPFAFDMPAGAQGTNIMEGSSPLAKANGLHVTVSGPFPPGKTFVQVACQLPADTAALDITQSFPGAPRASGRAGQEGWRREAQLAAARAAAGIPERGRGDHPARWAMRCRPDSRSCCPSPTFRITAWCPDGPRCRSPALIVLAGIWAAGRSKDNPTLREAERKRLIARREKLLADLVRLENDHRNGRGDRAIRVAA